VAVAHESRRILTGSWDGALQFWHASSGEELAHWKLPDDRIQRVALSADASLAATLAWEGRLDIWDTEAAEPRHTRCLDIERGDWISACTLSPDGTRLVTASFKTSGKLFDATTGNELNILSHAGLRLAQFSNDGTVLVTGEEAGGPMLKDAETGAELGALEGPPSVFTHALFSPDDRTLLAWESSFRGSWESAFAGSRVALWDVPSRTMLIEPSMVVPGGVTSAAFSADGGTILIGSGAGRVFLFGNE